MNQTNFILDAALVALVAFGSIRTILAVAKDGFGPVPTRQR